MGHLGSVEFVGLYNTSSGDEWVIYHSYQEHFIGYFIRNDNRKIEIIEYTYEKLIEKINICDRTLHGKSPA